MDQPAWLAAAWAEFGVREIPGKDDAAEILSYFREAGDTSVETEATPWCAAFAGAMLRRAGHAGTGSLLARSYLGWGDTLAAPRLGAITVLARGDDPTAGHVGFFLGETADKLFLLGGNQGDAVCVAGFDKARLIGLRWPHEEAEAAGTGDDDAIFLKSLAHVLEMEGGFSNDPYDPGGPTNRGITLDEYARFKGETVEAGSRPRLISELKRDSRRHRQSDLPQELLQAGHVPGIHGAPGTDAFRCRREPRRRRCDPDAAEASPTSRSMARSDPRRWRQSDRAASSISSTTMPRCAAPAIARSRTSGVSDAAG